MIKVLSLSEITVEENRQRKEFDLSRINELADSIQKLGLLHPPVVRKTESGYSLVAGERRLRAITSLSQLDEQFLCGDQTIPPGSCPVLIFSELNPLAAREAELEENIIRVDLSWQEKAAAIAELESLRSVGGTVTATALAKEIVGDLANANDVMNVRESLIVSKHLADPEVQKAKTQKEAIKLIEKKAKAAHREKLAEQFDLSQTPHKLINKDCREALRDLPDACIDVVLTDPPYGIDAQDFGEQSGTGHAYEDSREYFDSLMEEVVPELFRVMKSDSHLYLFCDPRRYAKLETLCREAGFLVWHVPLIWAKSNGMLPQPDFGPRRTYEMILFARKGQRKVLAVKPDVLSYSNEKDLSHGAQKPVDLFSDLLSRSANPGDTVLDTFAGSGTILPAATACSCRAVCIERDSGSFALCVERVNTLDLSL